jgi:hypothetical protein
MMMTSHREEQVNQRQREVTEKRVNNKHIYYFYRFTHCTLSHTIASTAAWLFTRPTRSKMSFETSERDKSALGKNVNE